MRLVIDTNVVISGLMGKGNCEDILQLVLFGSAEMVISLPILAEYVRVLNGKKFQYKERLQLKRSVFIEFVEKYSVWVEPDFTLNLLKDEPDNRFLEAAQAAEANYLITGNSRDFLIRTLGKTQIVSPSEFCGIFINSSGL